MKCVCSDAEKNDKSVVGLQSFLNLVSNIIYYSIILKENSSIKWKDFTWMRNTIRREEDNEHWHIYQIMARASLFDFCFNVELPIIPFKLLRYKMQQMKSNGNVKVI